MARPRSESARAKVVAAAHKLIAECGVDGFTVDETSKQSGVAKTTIYRHWESSNHLLLDAIDSMIEPMPTPDTGSLRSDLIEAFTNFSRTTSKPVMLRMMLGILARSADDASFKALKNDFLDKRHSPLRAIIDNAIQRGELPPLLDREMALDIIEGPFAAKRLLRGDVVPENQIPMYVDAILRGLGAKIS